MIIIFILDTRKFETSVNQGNIVQESEEITVPESAYPVNEIIQITNLVRPFTLMQLKEALREFGTIVEDGFWIDNIRSKCIVKVGLKHITHLMLLIVAVLHILFNRFLYSCAKCR